ncbi:uncharacterized protein LOC110875329 [Helianthus annuus]|uniref:uncharacterized protein LOC110875329 n=1 Tax=Helianthus annuus TaxID=4232 RepID=UPI000B8FF962|nr:uncharacterized protein LOC110875329 [Helianthus annuus]
MADQKLHPAVTVSNIKAFIPITLDHEALDYNNWSELFRLHCTAYLVADHLSPRTPPAAADKDKENETPGSSSSPADSWERLDAIVRQWMYGTISTDLLKTVIKTRTTAYDAWKAIESLFLENFSSTAVYCQELKVFSDQLSNVDAPVDEQTLVLQTIAGLTEQYETVSTILQNTKPLPSFFDIRSQLCMNETTKASHALHSATQASTALLTQSRPNHSPSNPHHSTASASQSSRDPAGAEVALAAEAGPPPFNPIAPPPLLSLTTLILSSLTIGPKANGPIF